MTSALMPSIILLIAIIIASLQLSQAKLMERRVDRRQEEEASLNSEPNYFEDEVESTDGVERRRSAEDKNSTAEAQVSPNNDNDKDIEDSQELDESEIEENDQENKGQPELPLFVQTPTNYHIHVVDNINGAYQDREESWNNGIVTGSYIAPAVQAGMWRKVYYKADPSGFHVIKEEIFPLEQLKENEGGVKTPEHMAKVIISKSDGEETNYMVTEQDKATNKKPAVETNPKVVRNFIM